MPIKINCPSCNKTLTAPDSAAGKKAKCPCGQVVTLPAAANDADTFDIAEERPSGAVGQTSAPPVSAPGDQARRPCPECGEMIIAGAAKCRFCNAIFDPTLKLMEGDKPGKGKEALRQIATYQRGVIYCILGQILAYVANIVLMQTSPLLAFIPSLVVLGALIAGTVFAVLLAIRVYSTGMGIAMGICAIIPCLGLVLLLIINQAATKMLTENGIKVGFLGASMSQF